MPFRKFAINVLLLVEDSEDDILITQRKLFKTNMSLKDFIVAKNLTDALKLIKEKSVDVILLDINLPESKGLNSLDAIRATYSGIVIVVTSLDDESTAIEAIHHGADDYLIKSEMNEHTLGRAILYSIERSKLHHHVAAAQDKLEQLSKLG
jgi:two-component system cell cycle sensor histidine kinase/response regulator CckA